MPNYRPGWTSAEVLFHSHNDTSIMVGVCDLRLTNTASDYIMPDIFTILTQNFWLVALLFTAINGIVYRQRFRAIAAQHPDGAAGYQQLLVGFVAVNVLVWGVMGLGSLVGGVPSVFEFFQPSLGNPWVILWHITLILLWIAGFVWLFVGTGAQFLVNHPAFFNFKPTSAWQIRLWYLACVAGGVLAEILMWTW